MGKTLAAVMASPVLGLLIAGLASPAAAQGPGRPIIDMHLHAQEADENGPPPMAICVPVMTHMPVHDPARPWGNVMGEYSSDPPCEDPVWSSATDSAVIAETVAAMDRWNMIGVLSGTPPRLQEWLAVGGDRFIPSLGFQLGEAAPSHDEVLRLFTEGRVRVFGEITNQYVGIAPDDAAMNPYWEAAQDADVPVAIHLGSGPPGAPHLGYRDMRIRDGSALLLEDVLVAYPRLRVSIMHYGHQRLDDTIALLEHHPHVYLDIGGIQWWYPRPYFYRQLQLLIDAGFGKRIMFGSDQMTWPGLIDYAIQVIDEAPFLTESQKRDIFYNNAARFLRLGEDEIARHHAGGVR